MNFGNKEIFVEISQKWQMNQNFENSMKVLITIFIRNKEACNGEWCKSENYIGENCTLSNNSGHTIIFGVTYVLSVTLISSHWCSAHFMNTHELCNRN